MHPTIGHELAILYCPSAQAMSLDVMMAFRYGYVKLRKIRPFLPTSLFASMAYKKTFSIGFSARPFQQPLDLHQPVRNLFTQACK